MTAISIDVATGSVCQRRGRTRSAVRRRPTIAILDWNCHRDFSFSGSGRRALLTHLQFFQYPRFHCPLRLFFRRPRSSQSRIAWRPSSSIVVSAGRIDSAQYSRGIQEGGSSEIVIQFVNVDEYGPLGQVSSNPLALRIHLYLRILGPIRPPL